MPRSRSARPAGLVLPRRKIDPRTTGKVYTAPDGKTFRPSMFLTLTCDSYGKVTADGTPADPESYDYRRAARDALHFAALFDRLVQNLRRFLGYDLQYFASIEPQKRLAPHVHIAMRGTVSRTELRQVIAATYHQVWWPSTEEVRFDGDRLPVWHEASGNYLDADTGEMLPAWDDALDAIGPLDDALHVARFGPKFDAQGVLAGSKDSGRCIRYLAKYLTKHVATATRPTPTPSATTPTGSWRLSGTSRARLHARTGSATASSPRTPGRPPARRVQGQGAPPRAPRLRRPPCPGLPQMVRQDPRRPPRRPQNLAPVHARPASRRRPLPVGARHRRRRRLHGPQQTTPARPRRPRPMAGRTRRSQAKSRRRDRQSFGNQEGSMNAQPPERSPDRLLTVQEAADRLRVSRWSVYNLIRSNQLHTIKIDRRRLVTPAALADCIVQLGEEAA